MGHLLNVPAQRGKAILYSSHVLEIVERLCTCGIVLYQGAIVADDSVAQLPAWRIPASHEDVFAQLSAGADPEATACPIAEAPARDDDAHRSVLHPRTLPDIRQLRTSSAAVATNNSV